MHGSLVIIKSLLTSPESHVIFVSFQNILNNHYEKVKTIIRSFNGITLKQLKDFNVFEKKEMPQELSEIKFSEKYKKMVVLFYEFLLKNPKYESDFVKLLETLPHNKESAIFIMKIKLMMKKKLKGGAVNKVDLSVNKVVPKPTLVNKLTDLNNDLTNVGNISNKLDSTGMIDGAKNLGMGGRDIILGMNAAYTTSMTAFITLYRSLLKVFLGATFSLAQNGNPTVDNFVENGVIDQNGGYNDIRNKLEIGTDAFAKKLKEYIDAILKSPGAQKILDFVSVDNLSAYLTTVGTVATIETLLPIEAVKVLSGLVNFLTASVSQYNSANEAAQSTNMSNTLNDFQKKKKNMLSWQRNIVKLLDIIFKQNKEVICETITILKVDKLEKKFCPKKETESVEPVNLKAESNTESNTESVQPANETEPVNSSKAGENFERNSLVQPMQGGEDPNEDFGKILGNMQEIIQSSNSSNMSESDALANFIYSSILLYKQSEKVILLIDKTISTPSDFEKLSISVKSEYLEATELLKKLNKDNDVLQKIKNSEASKDSTLKDSTSKDSPQLEEKDE